MRSVTISFVGQCHTVGYAGVAPDSAFPRVCKGIIEAARPETRVDVALEPYYHPSQLVGAVRAALRRRPRVVVFEVVGWLAVAGTRAVDLSRLPRGLRSSYDRMKHFRHVSRAIAQKIPRSADLIFRVQTSAVALAEGVLKPILPRLPRPTVAEYEDALESALNLTSEARVTAVVQGPGSPNIALDAPALPPDTLDRYREVNAMARRAAEAKNALYVDRWDSVSAGFFSERSIRPTEKAHLVWGHLLASELLRNGVV